MKKFIISICALLLVSGVTTTVSAQNRSGMVVAQGGQGDRGNGRPPQPGMRPGPGDGERFGGMRREGFGDLKRLERLRMMKLLDLLDLDSETEAKVIPYVRQHHQEMFEIMKRRQQQIDKLAEGLKDNKLSDAEILEQIAEIDNLEIERQQKLKEFLDEAGKLLTPEQLGKLYVFQARFGGEVLEKMTQFKKAREEFLQQGN